MNEAADAVSEDREMRDAQAREFWCWQRRWGAAVLVLFAAVFAGALLGWVVFW